MEGHTNPLVREATNYDENMQYRVKKPRMTLLHKEEDLFKVYNKNY